MKDKFRRYFKALKLLWLHFFWAKNDDVYMDWFLKNRNKGIPYERKADPEYIDWFLNWRKDLEKFQDIHKGEDCFIIGNGPSLNKTNLDLLNGFYVFGLNKIHLIFEKYAIDLSYHVAVNPLVIDQTKPQLEKNIYKCPSFLSFIASREIDNKLGNIYKLLTNAQWSFYHDITNPICEGYTVTYVALQIAYYMGFKNVYLIGMDHNFIQKGKANEEQYYKDEDVNHFHPDYFKGQQWHLADLEGNEVSYALAKHQFHAANRKIFDATVEGKLQVFEKIDFEDAIRLAKKKIKSKIPLL